jgi:2-oxoglutarate ferredoxin oxidoreductase subunit gamma
MKNMKNFSEQSSRYEIRIAGSGGQGILLAGIILAEAALLDGNYVAQSQSYGPETRGGNSTSDVVMSDSEIDYPRATKLDLLIALTQVGCNRNLAGMKEGGLVIVDSDLVESVPWETAISFPFGQIAQEVGESRAINMAALGAVAAFCPRISHNAIVDIMMNRLPPGKVEANLAAFDKVLKLASSMKGQMEPSTPIEEFEI